MESFYISMETNIFISMIEELSEDISKLIHMWVYTHTTIQVAMRSKA
jgi:hypothetical protein